MKISEIGVRGFTMLMLASAMPFAQGQTVDADGYLEPHYETLFGLDGLAVGDFDGDGLLDFSTLVRREGTDNDSYTHQQIGIGFGQSDGGFSLTEYRDDGDPAFGYAGGGVLFSQTADFNADGHAELLIADYSLPSTTYTQFWAVDTARQVTLASYFEYGGYTNPMLDVDDITGDGLPDLVTELGDYINLGGEYVFNFEEHYPEIPYGPNVVFIHDVTGDGIDDVGLRETDGAGVSKCVIYRGIARYQFDYSSPAGQCPRITVAVGDFNGDGLADYLGLRESRKRVLPTPAGSSPVYTLSQRVYVFTGKRRGGFGSEVLYGLVKGGPLGGIDIRDFDFDGNDDALIATSQSKDSDSDVFDPDIFYSPGFVTLVKGR